MIKYICMLLLVVNVMSFAQTKKEVTDGIFITFPSTPEYKVLQGNPTYSSKTDNALYMAVIAKNIIPQYSDYVQAQKTWSEKEKQQVIDALLDNAVRGRLDYTGSKGSSSKIKKGKFDGREIQFQAINPLTGNKCTVKTIILLVRNSLVSFEVWSMKDFLSSGDSDNYLNSISFY
ncbi:hypothetical protein [Myroides odoratimimus]|uniref:hypothetical protein n=1 Tax=Myroides odoratimimus TaxID=76832 RepID=UPI002574BA48|nr:hypothetical protein [Myroides odoratimimus]MDM1499495.1 hypothetical protein [Myroides odoratimimus]